MEHAKIDLLRMEVNDLVCQLGLQIGWRNHLSKALKIHPSSLNNALNGSRSGPREFQILSQLSKYLSGFYRYYQKCAPVNTKCH